MWIFYVQNIYHNQLCIIASIVNVFLGSYFLLANTTDVIIENQISGPGDVYTFQI